MTSRPIEPTPILEGKDAKAFWASMKNKRFSKAKELELAKSRIVYKVFSK